MRPLRCITVDHETDCVFPGSKIQRTGVGETDLSN